MPLYGIGGFCVELIPKYPTLMRQAEPYRVTEERPADFSVMPEESFLREQKGKYPEASPDMLEYVFTGSLFARAALRHEAIVLHASAVVLDGAAYLFSAASGTGKTTHTQMWLSHFGAERAFILNDDMPLIRRFPDGFRACGTPFAGSTGWSRNACVKLAGICFLERAAGNSIRRISAFEGVPLFLGQTPRARDAELLELQLATLDRLFREAPVYRMGCCMSPEAVLCAYEAMKGADA